MLVLSVLALVFVLPTVVTGIPLVNGVISGVGSSYLSRVKTLREAADANAPARNPGKLRVVENSGICGECGCLGATSVFTILAETTPHVYQASGYGDLAANESIWFALCFEVPFSIFTNIPSTGSGFLLHARTLKLLPSSRGSMAA